MTVPPELASLVAGTINFRVISDHWFELLLLALSIKTGTVTASVILRKLAAYPRQNGLALALRELRRYRYGQPPAHRRGLDNLSTGHTQS